MSIYTPDTVNNKYVYDNLPFIFKSKLFLNDDILEALEKNLQSFFTSSGFYEEWKKDLDAVKDKEYLENKSNEKILKKIFFRRILNNFIIKKACCIGKTTPTLAIFNNLKNKYYPTDINSTIDDYYYTTVRMPTNNIGDKISFFDIPSTRDIKLDYKEVPIIIPKILGYDLDNDKLDYFNYRNDPKLIIRYKNSNEDDYTYLLSNGSETKIKPSGNTNIYIINGELIIDTGDNNKRIITSKKSINKCNIFIKTFCAYMKYLYPENYTMAYGFSEECGCINSLKYDTSAEFIKQIAGDSKDLLPMMFKNDAGIQNICAFSTESKLRPKNNVFITEEQYTNRNQTISINMTVCQNTINFPNNEPSTLLKAKKFNIINACGNTGGAGDSIKTGIENALNGYTSMMTEQTTLLKNIEAKYVDINNQIMRSKVGYYPALFDRKNTVINDYTIINNNYEELLKSNIDLNSQLRILNEYIYNTDALTNNYTQFWRDKTSFNELHSSLDILNNSLVKINTNIKDKFENVFEYFKLSTNQYYQTNSETCFGKRPISLISPNKDNPDFNTVINTKENLWLNICYDAEDPTMNNLWDATVNGENGLKTTQTRNDNINYILSNLNIVKDDININYTNELKDYDIKLNELNNKLLDKYFTIANNYLNNDITYYSQVYSTLNILINTKNDELKGNILLLNEINTEDYISKFEPSKIPEVEKHIQLISNLYKFKRELYTSTNNNNLLNKVINKIILTQEDFINVMITDFINSFIGDLSNKYTIYTNIFSKLKNNEFSISNDIRKNDVMIKLYNNNKTYYDDINKSNEDNYKNLRDNLLELKTKIVNLTSNTIMRDNNSVATNIHTYFYDYIDIIKQILMKYLDYIKLDDPNRLFFNNIEREYDDKGIYNTVINRYNILLYELFGVVDNETSNISYYKIRQVYNNLIRSMSSKKKVINNIVCYDDEVLLTQVDTFNLNLDLHNKLLNNINTLILYYNDNTVNYTDIINNKKEIIIKDLDIRMGNYEKMKGIKALMSKIQNDCVLYNSFITKVISLRKNNVEINGFDEEYKLNQNCSLSNCFVKGTLGFIQKELLFLIDRLNIDENISTIKRQISYDYELTTLFDEINARLLTYNRFNKIEYKRCSSIEIIPPTTTTSVVPVVPVVPQIVEPSTGSSSNIVEVQPQIPEVIQQVPQVPEQIPEVIQQIPEEVPQVSEETSVETSGNMYLIYGLVGSILLGGGGYLLYSKLNKKK